MGSRCRTAVWGKRVRLFEYIGNKKQISDDPADMAGALALKLGREMQLCDN